MSDIREICAHEWLVVEKTRSINEYTGLENGWKRCRLCNVEAHFTRDVSPIRYPILVESGHDQ